MVFGLKNVTKDREKKIIFQKINGQYEINY